MSLSTSMQSSTPNNVIGTIAVMKIITPPFGVGHLHITELSVAVYKPDQISLPPCVHDALTITGFDRNYAEILLTFLQTLDQPVCLVAHNGRHYEFALLKAELDGWNLEMAPGTLCVDSLVAFFEIDKMHMAKKRGSYSSFDQCTRVVPELPRNLQQDYNWRPPNSKYGFRDMYERLFGTELEDEGVIDRRNVIVALVAHYGQDFIKYAETCAIPFKAMPSSIASIESLFEKLQL